MAASVPGGYGGAFSDEQGNVVVWLKDPSRSTKAIDALLTHQTGSRRVSRSKISVRTATYDWQELMRFRTLATKAWIRGQTVLMDIDERTNQVYVGVRDPSIEPTLRATLVDLGVPPDAVVIEATSPAVASYGEKTGADADLAVVTLRSTAAPPYYAGFMITGTGVPGPCSMGPQISIGSVTGFLTASHCTDQVFAIDGNTHFQPSSSGNLVGSEFKDAGGISHPWCAPATICRRSDAAIVKYNNASWAGVGLIARVTAIGSTTLTTTADDEWRVADDTPPCLYLTLNCFPPIVNVTTLNFVGQTSGWRDGIIRQSCVTVEFEISGSFFSVICADKVEGVTNGGDSGAAVFELTNDPLEVVLL